MILILAMLLFLAGIGLFWLLAGIHICKWLFGNDFFDRIHFIEVMGWLVFIALEVFFLIVIPVVSKEPMTYWLTIPAAVVLYNCLGKDLMEDLSIAMKQRADNKTKK